MKNNRLAFCAVMASLFAIVTCSGNDGPRRGGLVVILANDGTLALDQVKITVSAREQVLLQRDFAVPPTELPNTLSIVSNSSATDTATIAVSAWRGGTAVDRRDAIVTQIPTDRVVELRIDLSARCTPFVDANGSSTCGAGRTCDATTAQCVSASVDATSLPSYQPSAIGGDGGSADGAVTRPDANTACAPGAARCDGNTPQVCDASGAWRSSAACSKQTCVAGTCQGICAPGDKECGTTTSKVCDPVGSWTVTDLTAPKWTQTYGTAGKETTQYASALTETSDGNYLLAGLSDSVGYAVKFGPAGAKAWEKTTATLLLGAIGLPGGTVVCGAAAKSANGCTANRWCGYCAQLAQDGSVAWEKTILPSNNDWDIFNGVAPASGNGFIVNGYTTVGDPWVDIELRSFDGAGNATTVNKIHPKVKADELNHLRRAADGSYYGAGYVNQYGTCEQPYIAHFDGTTGAIKGELLLGPCRDETSAATQAKESVANAIIPMTDGSVIVAGREFNGTIANGFIAKYSNLDVAPALLWKKTYNGGVADSHFNAVELLPDGGYLLVGSRFDASMDTPTRLGDVFVVRTDAAGDQLWDHTYGGAGNDEGTAVLRAQDGTYLIGGFTSSSGAGSSDLYVLDLPVVCP